MKCKNCGFEHEQDFEYCVNCGAKAIEDIPTPVEAVSLNPAADVILPALRDSAVHTYDGVVLAVIIVIRVTTA